MKQTAFTLLLTILIGTHALSVVRCLADDSLLAAAGWKQNNGATQRFEINGTGERNNPLRRKLNAPFTGNELFVRYRLRYDARGIDIPAENDGEFFVLWLDDAEGNDAATHSGGVPNLGVHVSNGENRFMVRYAPPGEKYGPQLEGDREYLVVGRLWKSSPGSRQAFDRFDMWVDPRADKEFSPDASAKNANAVTEVRWIGFSTGRKTEPDDRIEVWDVELATSWEDILGLPPKPPSRVEQPAVAVRPAIDFSAHVFPILQQRCFKCHKGAEPESGVRLDVLDEVLNRTAPRNAAESRLYQLAADAKMPPEGPPLAARELAMLRTWIDDGLHWDERLLPTPIPETEHWAFQPIRRPEVPAVRNAEWVRTPVDTFIARQHEELGLSPAAEAPAATLARRLSLDVTGLPSIVHETTDVEELLANPAYGERWGRHWLDVARWAESNGHQHNRSRPYAWRYRDWVVDAFNDDKPYDEFIREQLAGDELEPDRDENVVATGFLAAARYSGNELDKDIQRNDILVDIVNTTAKAFLGLTLECAQCHTHKFDPISIRDYYRFQAFFAQGQPGNVVFATHDKTARTLIDERWRIFDNVHDRLVAAKRRQGHPEPIYVIPKSVVAGMKPAEKAHFQQLEKQIAELPQSWSFYSPVTAGRSLPIAPHDMRWPLPRDAAVLEAMQTSILIRGDVQSRGPEVDPGWPAVFGRTPADLSKPRTALAGWMTSPHNPLTARVWVNRIWQWHFGRGLVETSGDFGTQGTTPSHPELLDFLASELIDSGWSSKHVHRLILGSAAYRQSSTYSAGNAAVDPDNHYLWRWKPRRLEAEAVRDSMLAVSGQLDTTQGGRSVAADSRRRSLYLAQRRDNLPHQQMLFDSAKGNVSCSRRRVSTTALQPLWLMNSRLVQSAAVEFGRRAGSAAAAMELALGREATTAEINRLNELAKEYGLASACLAILNSSEFLYIP